MAVWLKAKVRDCGLELQPRLYAGSVCDDSAAEAACAAMWRCMKEPYLYPFKISPRFRHRLQSYFLVHGVYMYADNDVHEIMMLRFHLSFTCRVILRWNNRLQANVFKFERFVIAMATC